jgi:hypothetical protein
MQAFLMELLLTKGWRRGGEVFWTEADAVREGRALMRRKVAKGYRVLPVAVSTEAVAECLPGGPSGGEQAPEVAHD